MVITIVFLIALIPFLVSAYFLSQGKGSSLFAGLRTISDGGNGEYDEVALCKFMGKILYAISFSVLCLALSGVMAEQFLSNLGLTIMMIVSVFGAAYPVMTTKFNKA